MRPPKKVGTERVADNGYRWVKTPQGWKMKHHLVAERVLGRPLNNERVVFKDGNRDNLKPENLEVIPIKKPGAFRKTKTAVELLTERVEKLEHLTQALLMRVDTSKSTLSQDESTIRNEVSASD